MTYYVDKVRHDIPRTPYECPHWFRTTNDWFYWRRPRTVNAFKLKNAVDAQFRIELERRSNPLAYHASLVCQRRHTIFQWRSYLQLLFFHILCWSDAWQRFEWRLLLIRHCNSHARPHLSVLPQWSADGLDIRFVLTPNSWDLGGTIHCHEEEESYISAKWQLYNRGDTYTGKYLLECFTTKSTTLLYFNQAYTWIEPILQS